MALATLTDLEAQLASWLDRDDLTAEFPDFIQLCEQDVLAGSNDRKPLRVRKMEGRATTTGPGQYFALPNDFLELRDLAIIAPAPGWPLELADQDYIASHYPVDVTGTPKFYAIVGSEILLGPAPDSTAYVAQLDYYAFTPLTADAPANWLLTDAPGVYLFGALKYAAMRIRSPERAAQWQGMQEAALQGLIRADRFGRFPAGGLVGRPRGPTP